MTPPLKFFNQESGKELGLPISAIVKCLNFSPRRALVRTSAIMLSVPTCVRMAWVEVRVDAEWAIAFEGEAIVDSPAQILHDLLVSQS